MPTKEGPSVTWVSDGSIGTEVEDSSVDPSVPAFATTWKQGSTIEDFSTALSLEGIAEDEDNDVTAQDQGENKMDPILRLKRQKCFACSLFWVICTIFVAIATPLKFQGLMANAEFKTYVFMLPVETQEVILADPEYPSTPQSKALQWILQVHAPFTKDDEDFWRIEQRFALAVILFANNLSELVTDTQHECTWIPTLAGAPQICRDFIEAPDNTQQQTSDYAVTSLQLIWGVLVDQIGWSPVSSPEFRGTLPPEITLLPQVALIQWDSSLSLSVQEKLNITTPNRMQLEPLLPSKLGALTNLKQLILSNSHLTGTIPETIFEHLTNLQHLLLQNNALTGTLPQEIGLLRSNLTRLQLQHNLLSGALPVELAVLTKLGTIFVRGNAWETPVAYEICRGLESVAHSDLSTLEGGCGQDSSLSNESLIVPP